MSQADGTLPSNEEVNSGRLDEYEAEWFLNSLFKGKKHSSKMHTSYV